LSTIGAALEQCERCTSDKLLSSTSTVHVGLEWLASLAIGFGSMPLSLLTRFISRAVFGINVPVKGTEFMDMDIGYGAVVKHTGGKPNPSADETNHTSHDKETESSPLRNGK
jgi:hypothetical protein